MTKWAEEWKKGKMRRMSLDLGEIGERGQKTMRMWDVGGGDSRERE